MEERAGKKGRKERQGKEGERVGKEVRWTGRGERRGEERRGRGDDCHKPCICIDSLFFFFPSIPRLWWCTVSCTSATMARPRRSQGSR